MKRMAVILSLCLVIWLGSCVKDIPSVLKGSLDFTECITKKSALTEQAGARITWKEDGKLLVEMYNTEFCCGTDSLSLDETADGNSISCEIIDGGPFTYCNCPHDLSFTLESFREGQNYELILIESEHSYQRDTISFSFSYIEGLDLLATADSPAVTFSSNPLQYADVLPGGCNTDMKAGDANDFENDTVIFTPDGDSLDIFVGLMQTCCMEQSTDTYIEGDTLVMKITTENDEFCDCICYYEFTFKFGNYTGQEFFYKVLVDGRDCLNGKYIP